MHALPIVGKSINELCKYIQILAESVRKGINIRDEIHTLRTLQTSIITTSSFLDVSAINIRSLNILKNKYDKVLTNYDEQF